jgi:hypothetical protein
MERQRRKYRASSKLPTDNPGPLYIHILEHKEQVPALLSALAEKRRPSLVIDISYGKWYDDIRHVLGNGVIYLPLKLDAEGARLWARRYIPYPILE